MAVGRRRTWCPDPESGWGKAERGEVSRRGGEAKALRVVRPRAAAVASGERRRVGGLPPIPIQIGGEGSERGGGGEGEWGSWVGFGAPSGYREWGCGAVGPGGRTGRPAGPKPSGGGLSLFSLFFSFVCFLFSFIISFFLYFSCILI